jgi:hypothetical protein
MDVYIKKVQILEICWDHNTKTRSLETFMFHNASANKEPSTKRRAVRLAQGN